MDLSTRYVTLAYDDVYVNLEDRMKNALKMKFDACIDRKIVLKRILTVVSLFVISALSSSFAFSAELSVQGDSELRSGTLFNARESENGTGVKLESDGTWGALTWQTPDKTLGVGSAFTSDGEYIYVVRGLGDILLWRYSYQTDSWDTLTKMPYGAYYGSDLQYLNGYLYVLFGGYQNSFARYSIADDSWEILTVYPELVFQGASMATNGTDIFVITSNNTQSFYRYSVANDSWISLTGAPGTLRTGSDLEHVGGYIYTPRGNNTNTFYRYEISTNTWATMANMPGTMNDDVDITSANGYIYVARQNNTANFYRYEISTNTWTTLTDAPLASRYAGVQYLANEGVIYFFRGNNDYRFWKYDIANNGFIGPAEAPATLSTGSDMVYVGGYVYTTRGSNSTTFYRYNTATNIWETLSPAPASFNDDVRGFAAGGDIYFFRGGNTTSFYKYTIATDTWVTLASAPATVRYGGALAYVGGDYIYATRGNGTGTFWRYSISGDSWDTSTASLPAGIMAHYGATLLSDGTDVYFTSGYGIKRMFKYSIAGNSWSEVAQLPYSPYFGSDTTYDGNGHILALAGMYSDGLWEYSISDNSWRKLKSMPTYDPREIGTWTGASIVSDLSGNFYVSRGNGRQEIFVYTQGSGAYEDYAYWTSPKYDLTYVNSWGNLVLDSQTPSDSQITVQTRSSEDGISWTSWANLVGGVPTSAPNRYVQVKVLMIASTDLEYTPVFEGFTLEYTSDTTSPDPVLAANGYSQEISGESLVSGTGYKFTSPFFSWTPSTDGESSVEGYYVYFGSNASGDPVANGSFQYGNTYSVLDNLSNGSNYLRIVVKDILGNLSSAETVFEYVYEGVAPVVTLDVDSGGFSGTFVSSQVGGTGLTLERDLDGFWLEDRLAYPTVNLGYGAKNIAYSSDLNKLYIPTGMNNQFYEYDINTDAWTRLADAPNTIYYGGGVVSGPDGYIYALRGNNNTDFWRYNISTNTWETSISPAPLTIGYGGSMVYDGYQYIYVLRGNNSDIFWRYDSFSDTWESLSKVDFGAPGSAINNNAYIGASMSIDRVGGKIYAIQGNLYPGFAVYDINTNSWEVLGSTPSLPYYGAGLAYDGNGGVFYVGGNYNPYMFRYDIETSTWEEVAPSPLGFYYGGGIHKVGDYLYGIRGGNSTFFYKYNIQEDSWLLPKRGLFSREFEGNVLLNTYYGADILKGEGSTYYITRGNLADDFVSWNDETGELTRLPNLPMGSYLGSSMAYDSTSKKIYYTGGQYDRGFFVFDIENETWSEESLDPIPVAVNSGSSMVYDGSRYIYLARASSTNTFYRFDTQGVAGSKWTTMANVLGSLGYGAELLLKGDDIYTLQGNNVNNNPFYKYSISGNSWSTLAAAPSLIYNDGFLVDGGNGKFYAAKGANTTDFYSYSLADNTWSQLPKMPLQLYAGGAGESNLENKILVIPGNGTNTYQDALYTYVMSTESSGFVRSGSYESQVHDLGEIYRWANLVVDFDSFENTNINILTTTSADGLEWDEYLPVTRERSLNGEYQYKINSPVAQYIKVKFEISSIDGINTPKVGGYTLNYYRDTANPSNPDVLGLSAKSAPTGGQDIESDTWYNFPEPSFEWPIAEESLGATDGANGSGIAGYYVYWGPSDSADPYVEGVFQENNTFSPTTLVDSTEYHLRVRSVDLAGNLSDDIWEPFIYKYDGTGPVQPSSLEADPSGYTATDSFEFSWEEVLSSGAPVVSYCYKTGATSGTYSSDQCISATSISGIPSYKVGTNTFSVRAKDSAGNYSSYSTVSYFYVDSEHAPAPPTNLTVTPVNSNSNSFGFDWDPPANGTFYGSVSNLSYLYSINAIPTAYSTSATSLTYLNPGAYATLPGENIFYIVTKDEAGNVNYNNYTSVSFFANTVAPGIPIDMEIADVSVKNTSSWRLALSWDPPVDEGSGVSGYQIFRSVDGESFFMHSYTTASSLVDTRLIQTIYYYKVRACDSTNNCGAFSEVVSLFPDGRFTEAAELIVEPIVSDVSPKKATVSWVTARTADSKVAYGVEPGVYYEEEVSNSEQVVDHTLTINNLTPGTKYYYVVRWTDEDGNTGQSEETSFETAPPPSIQEPIVKSVGLSSALIQFTTKDTIKVRVLYGESSSFGGMVEVYTGTAEGTHNVELPDLKDGTKYFYKINTFDIDGAEYEGEIHTFETLPRPQILDPKIYQVSGTSSSTLLVEWSSNTPISSVVTYYPSSSPERALDEVNVALKNGKHRMILLNLEANTTYSIIISGRDFMGNEASSGVKTFATASDTRPPQIFDLEVSSEIIGAGQEATAQLVISYKTDEPATSQVEFGEGTGATYSQRSQEDTVLSENHIVILSGLTPSKVYHLRAMSKDAGNNVGYSVDKVVVTSSATDNAFDLAVNSLVSIFSFLGR